MSKNPIQALLQDVAKALGPNGSEVETFAALQAVGTWAEAEKVHKVTLHLDKSVHALFEKRLRVLRNRGMVPESLIFTLQNSTQTA